MTKLLLKSSTMLLLKLNSCYEVGFYILFGHRLKSIINHNHEFLTTAKSDS